MEYTRIYADGDGETHFEDVSVPLSPADFAPPAPPLDISVPGEAERTVFARVPAGWYGEAHPTPKRQYWVQISGVLEVGTSDGEVRRFPPGSVVLLEDLEGKGHTTRAVGGSETRGLFVQLPEPGSATQPLG